MPSAMACGSRLLMAWSEASGSLNSRVTRTERIFAAGATPDQARPALVTGDDARHGGPLHPPVGAARRVPRAEPV